MSALFMFLAFGCSCYHARQIVPRPCAVMFGERNEMLEELRMGSLVAKVPIVQGGMGVGISLAGLASAVAEQGGIGVIATPGIGMDEADYHSNTSEANRRALRKEIRAAREKTEGVIGVNIMVAMTNFADMVETSIDEGIDVIFSGAGLPLDLPRYLVEGAKTKLVPIVSSGRAAKVIARRWLDRYAHVPDAFVVEGPLAGGHLGFKRDQIEDPAFALRNLVADVVREKKRFEDEAGISIPVIAGGGIYTGEDMFEIMEAGADGVQLGTRFVATGECDASDEFKGAIIESDVRDIAIISSPVGMPGRAIRNGFLDAVEAGKRKPFKCPHHCIVTCEREKTPYCISLALMNAKKGNLANGFAFAGANAHRVDRLMSVKELMDSLKAGYAAAEVAAAFPA